jgi:tetratricopeptide (TPR) repeat protein
LTPILARRQDGPLDPNQLDLLLFLAIAKPVRRRMAKTRRLVKTIRAVKKPVKKKVASKKAVEAAPRRVAPPSAPVAASVAAPPPVRKPGFYEAVAIYERGVQALQRHDFAGAAGFFRTVLDRYPEERELLERARLYLRVCERETSRQQPVPKTPAERVYAATVALNSGDNSLALDHLQRALVDDPESDHAHYIMAVALGMRGRTAEALEHLRRSIELNPENRSLARQDPDLDGLRGHQIFRSVLETPAALARRKTRSR